jgi:hypothetical protein
MLVPLDPPGAQRGHLNAPCLNRVRTRLSERHSPVGQLQHVLQGGWQGEPRLSCPVELLLH